MDYCFMIEIRDSQPGVIQYKGREGRIFPSPEGKLTQNKW